MGKRSGRVVVLAAVLALVAAGAWWLRRDAHGPLVHRPSARPPAILIRDVRVIDVVTGSAAPHRDVLIEGDTIARVDAHDPSRIPPPGAVVHEGAGLSLVPGLIDAHCHVGSSPDVPWDRGLPDVELNLSRLLYAGVTRVLDPGSATPDIFELRAAIARGETLGPSLHAAGPVFTAVGGHPEPMVRDMMPGFLADAILPRMTRPIGSSTAAREAVDALVVHRPDFVKMAIDRIPSDAPRLAPELAAAIARAARGHGVRALAHIGDTRDALDAAEAGVSAWIHGVYKEPIAEADLPRLVAAGIPMVPTMVVFASYARLGRGSYPATRLEQELAPPSLLAARVDRPEDFEVSKGSLDFLELLARERRTGVENARRLFAAGVPLMAGSDSQAGVIHGASLHRELHLLAEAGLSPLEVLRATTLVPARFLADTDDPPYGVVAPGKRADLVLVRGDPLASVDALQAIESVWLGGVRLERNPRPVN